MFEEFFPLKQPYYTCICITPTEEATARMFETLNELTLEGVFSHLASIRRPINPRKVAFSYRFLCLALKSRIRGPVRMFYLAWVFVFFALDTSQGMFTYIP